jgi:soluble lytic murein transglycosylase-like protein
VADYSDAPAKTSAATAATKHAEYHSEPAADSAPTQSASAETADAAAPGKDVEVRRGAVYKVTRANGVVEYTNMRPNRGGYQLLFTYISTCYACNIHSTINWTSTALNLNAYRTEVAAAATEFGVDPSLLRAVIHAESAFNPNAISDKGAEGLMQLIPGTASDMGVNNPFDVTQNIRGGAQYLAGLLKQFNGDERMATAAYNAGPQNVLKYNGVPPFDETRVYVDRVATLRQRYHAAE